MKKSLLLLGILAVFAFVAVAQDASQAGGAQGTTTSSTGKKSAKSGGHSGMDMDHQGTSKNGGKSSTITGCLSSSPNSEGMYTLTNAKMKKGVEVGPADTVKEHAGHKVSLTGKWATGAEAGEKEGAEKAEGKEEKGERHFEVASVKHISDTCSETGGMGSKGTKSKGKSSGETASTPKGL